MIVGNFRFFSRCDFMFFKRKENEKNSSKICKNEGLGV